MTNESFIKASYEQKLNELVLRHKELLQNGKSLEPFFFLFDKTNKLHVVAIKEKALLKAGREKILKNIIHEKIDVIKKNGIEINKILHIKEAYFDQDLLEDENDMNIDHISHKMSGNPSLIVTVEDAFDFELKVYDIIRIEDEGVTYTVISKDPIYQATASKLDPDTRINTSFKNLI